MDSCIKDLWSRIQNEKSLNPSYNFFDSSSESISLPETYSPRTALISIFASIKDLSATKRNFFMIKNYEDFLTTDQYQPALQALEAEVRNHIKVQQQLKLFIENQNSKLEELEQSNESEQLMTDDQLALLSKENSELEGVLAKKEAEIKKFKANELKSEVLALRQQIKRDSDKLEELEGKKKILGESWAEIEAALDKQTFMIETLKAENEKLRGIIKARNKSADRERNKSKLTLDRSRKQLAEILDKKNNRSLSPCIIQTQTLVASRSNINLNTKKSLIRDESIEKIQTERQLTSKRKL